MTNVVSKNSSDHDFNPLIGQIKTYSIFRTQNLNEIQVPEIIINSFCNFVILYCTIHINSQTLLISDSIIIFGQHELISRHDDPDSGSSCWDFQT